MCWWGSSASRQAGWCRCKAPACLGGSVGAPAGYTHAQLLLIKQVMEKRLLGRNEGRTDDNIETIRKRFHVRGGCMHGCRWCCCCDMA